MPRAKLTYDKRVLLEDMYTREQIIDALLDNDKEINFTKPPKPRKKSKNKQ